MAVAAGGRTPDDPTQCNNDVIKLSPGSPNDAAKSIQGKYSGHEPLIVS